MSDGASLEQIHKYQTKHGVPSFNICFVVVRHPQTKRFLAVKETCDRGWWLPAGRVDPGETFQEAAIRETIEEAGIRVRLTGILSIQFAPQPTCIRMRYVNDLFSHVAHQSFNCNSWYVFMVEASGYGKNIKTRRLCCNIGDDFFTTLKS
eukprot:TRINITY_DN3818_c0_g1_i13.p1 TRINITY_DN3818_c0_g1~~TRINITY_DN3818_c0_g1_i13.p1  ORF type:complete len:170 (-),score=28.17 TRINITY_DN3818_c0_g1_i13:427-876(-)